MSDIETSVSANRDLLRQGLSLLEALTDDQYARRRGGWAPVGAQYRHVLEHYQCLLGGLPHAAVDYDARARDSEVESSRDRAAGATRDVLAALGGLAARPAHGALRVQMATSAGHGGPEWSHSTLARELQFLVSHTVHHYALIKLLLAADDIDPGADFGLAPSTVVHARALG